MSRHGCNYSPGEQEDILEASRKYKGKPQEVALLLENLGFEDGIDKVSVTSRTEEAVVAQTDEQSSLEIAQHLCSQAGLRPIGSA